MNEIQYRTAAAKLLDRDAPDVVMECILIAGTPPGITVTLMDEANDYVQWVSTVERHLIERYGYKPDKKLTTVVIGIIERRIWDVQCKARSAANQTRPD